METKKRDWLIVFGDSNLKLLRKAKTQAWSDIENVRETNVEKRELQDRLHDDPAMNDPAE
jgi:hypothetical protein